jgi:predicted PurR-regulated permease PerM
MIVVNFVTAIAQGAVGALSFVIVGLPSPVVWAALMALFSFVPMVGTGIVWVPAGVILLLTGRIVAGIFILAWGVFVIGTVDNLLRPLLAKGRIDLHPLLVFLTIFGGIVTFGVLGVILGPMIGSIFAAMVRIWKRDFVPRLFARS